MYLYVSGNIGLIHLVASVLAVIFGTIILLQKKGTRLHKQIGYWYIGSMAVLLITAFMLYNLFGGFGIFHVAAIVSSVTLVMGMWPAFKRSKPNWIMHHLAWMYWSVFGLYAAFASEIFTRVVPTEFFSGVGIATGLIMAVGAIGFKRNKKIWEKKFVKS